MACKLGCGCPPCWNTFLYDTLPQMILEHVLEVYTEATDRRKRKPPPPPQERRVHKPTKVVRSRPKAHRKPVDHVATRPRSKPAAPRREDRRAQGEGDPRPVAATREALIVEVPTTLTRLDEQAKVERKPVPPSNPIFTIAGDAHRPRVLAVKPKKTVKRDKALREIRTEQLRKLNEKQRLAKRDEEVDSVRIPAEPDDEDRTPAEPRSLAIEDDEPFEPAPLSEREVLSEFRASDLD